MSDQRINEVQNEVGALDLLAASSVLNWRTEIAESARWVTVLLVSVSGCVAAVLDIQQLSSVAAIAGILFAVFSELIWPRFSNQARVESVLIQERFDTVVLSIAWNPDLGAPVPSAAVNRLNSRFKGDRDALMDWYLDVRGVPSPVAELVCQRENAQWSVDLRARFVRLCGVLLTVWLVLGIALSLMLGWLVFEYLYRYAAPTLSIPLLLLGLMRANRAAVETKNELREKIDLRLLEISPPVLTAEQEARAQTSLRSNQDQLFRSRVESPRVPGWMYRAVRARYAKLHAMDSASMRNSWVGQGSSDVSS